MVCCAVALPLCWAWGWDAGGLAATPRAPTLAVLPNLIPDFWEGREESEELPAVSRDWRCCRVLVLRRNVRVAAGPLLLLPPEAIKSTLSVSVTQKHLIQKHLDAASVFTGWCECT